MGIDLNPVHLLDEAKDDLFGSSAAVPRPGHFTSPAMPESAWRATSSGGGGQLSVHRDVVTRTSALIRGNVQDLDQVLSTFGSAASGGASVTGWATADGFSANVAAVNQRMAAGGGQVSDAHLTAAAKLSATAGTYDTAEADTTRAIGGIAAQLGVSVSGIQAV